MAYTYAQLQQAIIDFCAEGGTEPSFVTHVPDFVRHAEKDVYNRVQALASRQNQTGTISSGNRFVAIPTSWLATYSFTYTDASGSQHNLLLKQSDFITEAFPNPTALSPPQFYALYDISTFLLGPTPDASYAMEINYLAYPASLVDVTAGTTTWLSLNYDHVLLYGSLKYAYTYMKGEADLIAKYTELFEQGLNEIKQLVDGKNRRDNYRNGNVSVQVT
jgi:hypothetical protein